MAEKAETSVSHPRHAWRSATASGRYEYQVCSGCSGRRIIDRDPMAADPPQGGGPVIGWVAEAQFVGTVDVTVVETLPPPLYIAVGACSACDYRTTCHPARQRAQDRRGLGRHTSCEFYLSLSRRPAVAPQRAPAWYRWIARLLGRRA